jgi:hypothetical protein
MISLRSVDAIAKEHIFERELSAIPANYWMGDSEDYDIARKKVVKKLRKIDKTIGSILDPKDDCISSAVNSTFGAPVRKMTFRYPELSAIHAQKDLVDELIIAAISGSQPSRNLRSQWEANPSIEKVELDECEMWLGLQHSALLLQTYLNSFEEEMYKVAVNSRLDEVLHEYGNFHKGKPKLMGHATFVVKYAPTTGLSERIYEDRGKQYMTEGAKLSKLMSKNKYSSQFILTPQEMREAMLEAARAFPKS